MDSSAQEHVMQLVCGYWNSQCVCGAAKLGIADLLAKGPLPNDDLADRTGTHPPSHYRLLRALASFGIFAEEPGNRFRLTPAAEVLQSDGPGSKRALTILFGEEYFRAWGDLLIHEGDEEKATRVLENIRRAIAPNGRVLIVETVIPPGNEPCFAKLLDLTMLVAPGGQERTEEEYGSLLGRAGFRLTRTVRTATEDSVIEGGPK